MRAFLAVTPDPATCHAIDAWRLRCWPAISRAVPAQNYHITLAFLGDISSTRLERLQYEIDGWRINPMQFTLNDVGYWPGSQVLWLGMTQHCKPLLQLAASCATLANRVGIRVSRKNYLPHLTLARSVDLPPAPALIPPEFTLDINHLELYQSILDRSGARYIEQRSWPCRD